MSNEDDDKRDGPLWPTRFDPRSRDHQERRTRPGEWFQFLYGHDRGADVDGPLLQCLEDVERLVNRISMPLLSMRFRVDGAPRHHSFRVVIDIHSMDRDPPCPPLSHNKELIYVTRATEDLRLPMRAGVCLEYVRRCATELWKHEFDEHFKLCGERVSDPHLELTSRDRLPGLLNEACEVRPPEPESRRLKLTYNGFDLVGFDRGKKGE